MTRSAVPSATIAARAADPNGGCLAGEFRMS